MKSQRCQCRDIEGELASYLLGSADEAATIDQRELFKR
jgi:hypothetical protein